MNIVHITHEATQKMGGIGTVLEGLLTADAYQSAVDRTVLVGMWSLGSDPADRLGADSKTLYSVCDGIDEGNWRALFRPIEEKYRVWICYGKRRLQNRPDGKSAEVETLLFETSQLNAQQYDYFKATFYQRFGIASGDYEQAGDYDEWMRIAEPAYEACRALLDNGETAFIAHEYMGMPTALKAVMENERGVCTAFYAHEVATARAHVEHHPGHDTRFYNLMRQSRAQGGTIEQALGNQWGSHRHALIERAQFCGGVFAVGDLVQEEYRFLSEECAQANIRLVYNGAPAKRIDLNKKKKAKGRLVQYARNLLGFQPDYIFTHVTRLVPSKGLWRDLRVLETLDERLRKAGLSAAMFILSTEIGPGRPGEEMRRLEKEYGWPVYHREGYPDLVGGEIQLSRSIDAFNERSSAAKVVFVNQFGWSQERCGDRMPAEMSFLDIRQGTDAEFGQSIYEPFGIAQIEPISFGAVCVVTNVCGCVGFVQKAAGETNPPNLIAVDYTQIEGGHMSPEAADQIGWAERDAIERRRAAAAAEELFERLPKNDAEAQALLDRGYEIARKMSWETVAEEYFLKALKSCRPFKEKEAESRPKLV